MIFQNFVLSVALALLFFVTISIGAPKTSPSSDEYVQVEVSQVTDAESTKASMLRPPTYNPRYCHEKYHDHRIHPKNKLNNQETDIASEEIIVDYRNGRKYNYNHDNKQENIKKTVDTTTTKYKEDNKFNKYNKSNYEKYENYDNSKFENIRKQDYGNFRTAKYYKTDDDRHNNQEKSVFEKANEKLNENIYNNAKFDSGYYNSNNEKEMAITLNSKRNYYKNRNAREYVGEYNTKVSEDKGYEYDVPENKFEDKNIDRFDENLQRNGRNNKFNGVRSNNHYEREGRSRQFNNNNHNSNNNQEFHAVVNKSGNGLHLFRVMHGNS